MEFLDKKQTEIHTGPLGRLVQRSRLDIEIDAIHNAGFHVPVGTHATVFVFLKLSIVPGKLEHYKIVLCVS